jgi:hypothetical protein
VATAVEAGEVVPGQIGGGRFRITWPYATARSALPFDHLEDGSGGRGDQPIGLSGPESMRNYSLYSRVKELGKAALTRNYLKKV